MGNPNSTTEVLLWKWIPGTASGVRRSLFMHRTIGIVVELAVDADQDFALDALPGVVVAEIPGALNTQVGRFSRTAFLRAAHGAHYTRTA